MDAVFKRGAMRRTWLAIALVLVGAGPARANGVQTGEQLLANCQSSAPQESASCRDYVSGAVDAIHTSQSQTFVCAFIPPDGFSEEQAVGVVIDYLKSHPDERQRSGAYNINAALAAAYPCPK
ncbi:MAG TPA: Rap1a/Tai family immunity protein [Dongiaceae bacterium]|jgi:hypothetical protein|nr:Rap1a/Tai family immunity protein [Dongiaceae bacterium]